jgi:hypothetical protein
MLMLSQDSLSRWLATRPQDVREFIAAGDPAAFGEDDGLVAALASVEDGTETDFDAIPELLELHSSGVKALGRVGRIRLLAWLADNAADAYAPLIHRITALGCPGGEGVEEDEEEGTQGQAGSGAVGVLFLEDIIQLAKAVVGPRMAARLASKPGLDAAVEAAASLDSDITYTQGGI